MNKMTVSPLISIITPTFNDLSNLKNCIESVKYQDYEFKEHIIIDGGSIDGTVEYLLEESKLSPDLVWINEKDHGIYDAMNKGISLSKGDFLIFLGADDVFYSNNTIKNIFSVSEILHYDFIYGRSIFKNSKLEYGGKFTTELLKSKNICHQSIFYKRSVFDILGFYGSRFKISEDYLFNIKCFQSDNISKLYIDKVISIFNDTGISSTQNYEFIRYRLKYFQIKSILDYCKQFYFFYRPKWFKPSRFFSRSTK